MTPCITPLGLKLHPKQKPIHITFDAPRLSSDGGFLLLQGIEDQLGLCAQIASHIPDNRLSQRIKHSRLDQLKQRAFLIALGYQDCNDSDWMRHDPLLKLALQKALTKKMLFLLDSLYPTSKTP